MSDRAKGRSLMVNMSIKPGAMKLNAELTVWTSLASGSWMSEGMILLLCSGVEDDHKTSDTGNDTDGVEQGREDRVVEEYGSAH